MSVFNKRRAAIRKVSCIEPEIRHLVTATPSYMHTETSADRKHKQMISRYYRVAKGIGYHKHAGSKSKKQLNVSNYRYVSEQFR